MRLTKILSLLTAALVSQTVLAGDPSGNTPSPFGDIQAQLDALVTRTQVLEDSAANSNIDGRTYCSILNIQSMRAWPGSESEETQNNVIRRVVSFENGLLTGNLLSNTLNNHSDIGTISHTTNNPAIDPLLANYLQMGIKVDITFGNGTTANWHVSKDGSVIFGSRISDQVFGNGAVSVGFVRTWTLIEIDPLDSCDAEDQ
jgi:hypothetical protein